MQINVIKQKPFHVEEDFYEEIINGLESLQDREQARKGKQPIIVLPRQARFISYITTPIIMGQIRPLAESVTRFQYEREKELKRNNIRQLFSNAWAKLTLADEQIDDDIEDLEKGKGFSVFKVMKVLRTFRTVARIYTALKAYKKPDRPKFDIDLSRLTNPRYFEEFEAHISEVFHGQNKELADVITAFMYPTAKNLFTMYDQKLEEFYQEFWWWCFKQLIFDPNSALDWVILIVGTIAAVGAGVLSRDPKATVGVFTLIRSIAGAAKITKFLSKGVKMFKRITGATQGVAKVVRVGRGMKFISRVPKNIKVAKTPLSLTSRLKIGWKSARKVRSQLKWGMNIYSGIDMLDVTKEDVEDYRAYITRRTTVWGSRFEAKYSDDLSRMLNMGADIFEFADDGVADKIRNIMSTDVGDEDRISRVLSEKYNRDITVIGFKRLNLVKKLSGIAAKVSLFFTKALFGLGDILTKKDFIIKNGGEVVIENKKYFTVVFPNTEKKWERVFTEESSEKGKTNMSILTRDIDMYFVSFKNGTSFKEERKWRTSQFRVADKSFKKIYTDGFASGFQVKIRKDSYDDGAFVNFNNPKKPFTVVANPTYMKGYVKTYDDGVITFSYDLFRSQRHDLNSIVEDNNNRLIQEKAATKTVEEITDMIQRAYANKNIKDDKNIVRADKDKVKKESQAPTSFMDAVSKAPTGMTY